MAKAPPSFDFFPNDFLGGTMHLTTEEIGAYLLMMMYQWANGHIPNDELLIRRIIRVHETKYETIWFRLKEKFELVFTPESGPDDRPVLQNRRLAIERERRISIWNAHKSAGKLGGRPKKEQSSDISQEKPNGFDLVSKNKTKSKPNGKTEDGRRKSSGLEGGVGETKGSNEFQPPTPKEVSDYAKSINKPIDADRFVDFYESKGWMVGKNRMKDWKASARSWISRNLSEVAPGMHNSPPDEKLPDVALMLVEERKRRQAAVASWLEESA